MVDPRRSLPDVCVAVLAASFAAADGIGVPRCFVTPIIKPFGQIVANILEHASVRWFYHRSSGTRDIVITAPAVPAVWSDCSSEWFWRSPLIHYPNHRALEPTCS
jgi:hypothetical protein